MVKPIIYSKIFWVSVALVLKGIYEFATGASIDQAAADGAVGVGLVILRLYTNEPIGSDEPIMG